MGTKLIEGLVINFLLTEREGRTGEYWPEVVAVRTERSEVRTKTTEGQYSPVWLELARLLSSLLYGFRDRVNAEIVHFYANKIQKMHHRNFNASQDARH